MRLNPRDLRPLLYFGTHASADADGDVTRIRAAAPEPFLGNLQPAKAAPERGRAGFAPNHRYVCYTTARLAFRELGRVADGAREYEVTAVERWSDYVRLSLIPAEVLTKRS